MHRQTTDRILAFTLGAMLICCLSLPDPGRAASKAKLLSHRLQMFKSRQTDTDLEVTGMLAGLPAGTPGYVRYADLLSLPQVSVTARDDDNFPGLKPAQSLRVSGVYLEDVARALGVYEDSDLVAANCIDNYRGHFPATYIVAHHPILALTINDLSPNDWAQKAQQHSVGPYFVTYSHFVPAFKILSHEDMPQEPANVILLNFSTAAATYGAIAPRGTFPPDSPVQQGFNVAKQNCLRCHNLGPYGGTKSGRTWFALGTWAREQPAFFANYVHNPKAFETNAKMPPNPAYDAPTLSAITAYFQTFADQDSFATH